MSALAQVIPLQRAASWREVADAHRRAIQMATQSVEAFAEVGLMLLELKAQTPHGEFQKRCAEAFQIGNTVSDLDNATRSARMYMRLAAGRATWSPHKPESLNAALKLLAAPKAEKKVASAPRPAAPIHTDDLEAEIRRRVAEAVAERLKEIDALEAKLKQQIADAQIRSKSLAGWMTHDEYRLILGCLHSDRQPPDQQARYDRAFGIFKKVEPRWRKK